MPLISKSFISERLLPAIEIDKVIGNYVKLTRSGASYKCCCPFHHEKTPSFYVTPSKNLFYCFGCHEHGTAIDFIMKFKNLGFVDAVEELAASIGMSVEYEAGHRSDNSDKYKLMYELMDRAAAAFTHSLFDEAGAKGLEYFTKERGLSKETIIKARLGFAPDGWHFMEEKVCRNEQEVRMLTDLGLIVAHADNRFSMYRNRVMIPIFDRKGRIISFGGRTMGDDKPKYMNTKETPIYRKRNELFGLYEALQANNNRPQRLVVVEGYMDVISVRQAGFTSAVASLGTATTPEQFKMMFRYCKKIVCCYDGDEAGRNAAWHALLTITPVLEEDVEVRFAFLPSEDDPDSLVRTQGLGAFIRYLDDALSYPEFLVSHLKDQYDITDPNARARFFSEVVKHIRTVPHKSLQEVCIDVFASKSGIGTERAWSLVDKVDDEGNATLLNPRKRSNEQGLLATPMRCLIAFALQYPMIIAKVYEAFKLDDFLQLCRDLKIRGADSASELIASIGEVNAPKIALSEAYAKTDKLSTAVLLARVDDPKLRLYYDQLAMADLGDECRDGTGELSKRITYLAKLLPTVLVDPLLERTDELKAQIEMGGADEALTELTILSRELKKRNLIRF